MAGKAICFLHVFFEAGSFPSLHLVILFVRRCNTVHNALTKVFLPEVWPRMLLAAVSDQLWSLQPSQHHPYGQHSCPSGPMQVNSTASQHGMEMQKLDSWSSQRRKPERGTRFIVALAMAVAVRQCAAEAQPWNQTSGNTNKLS